MFFKTDEWVDVFFAVYFSHEERLRVGLNFARVKLYLVVKIKIHQRLIDDTFFELVRWDLYSP